MINKKSFVVVLIMISAVCTTAQVRFSGNPASMGRNADAILGINASSMYVTPVEGHVEIVVTEENSSQQVLTLMLSKVIMMPGNNSLSRFRSQAARTFYSNELSAILRNTGKFGPGNYSICCQFIPEDKLLEGINSQHCFYSNVFPTVPLMLIHPADSICNMRPAFIWQGRKTSDPGVAFKVICVEVKKDQTAEEAMQNNPPVVNELIYQQVSQISFPQGSPALKEGKKYAWQVLEAAGKTVLNSSEIYEFSVGCKTAADVVVKSFAEVKPSYTGKVYHFTDAVYFSFTNPYAEASLKYNIIELATRKKLTNLPEIKMSQGLNNITMDISDIKGLEKDKQYSLEIYNLASTKHYINFKISE